MKLSSEIARTKKNVFFFLFSVSSVQTDNKKKKSEFTQAEMTQCSRAETNS